MRGARPRNQTPATVTFISQSYDKTHWLCGVDSVWIESDLFALRQEYGRLAEAVRIQEEEIVHPAGNISAHFNSKNQYVIPLKDRARSCADGDDSAGVTRQQSRNLSRQYGL
jgi:hypothetical protein